MSGDGEPRGYEVIDPGLDWVGNPDLTMPPCGLSEDAQVRCLAYLARKVREIVELPQGIGCKVMVMVGHPALGVVAERPSKQEELLSQVYRNDAEGKVTYYVRELGVERLLELSAGESLTWSHVLRASVMAP